MRLILPLFVLLFLASYAPALTNFQQCVDAGYLVMESYPRQCVAQGVTYVEEIDEEVQVWSFAEILDVAQNSECVG
ncbi:MAG: hypothetical protein ACLFSN_02635 [Candidatus Woesearchaeota archaeon]